MKVMKQRLHMPFKFTDKQADFISDIKSNNLSRINILEGSVRSGKTYISLIAWAMLLGQYSKNNNFLMVGKTLTSLKRNCLTILESLLRPQNFNYSLTKKEANIFGRRIFLEGVNDSRAEHKIRGMTLQAAYCDELTLFTEDFFQMLLSRLSLDGSKLLATTNPDSPNHWLKKNFIDRSDELNIKIWKFRLDDNDTIPIDIRESFKKEYTGVFYDRFILGNWVQADGVIYSSFANNTSKYIIDYKDIKTRNIDIVTIGIDYGASKSHTAFSAVAFLNGFKDLYVIDEKIIEGIKEPDELYKSSIEFYRKVESKYGWISCCFADWGGLGQILTKGLNIHMTYTLGERGIVRDCKKPKIINRINILNRLISAGHFKVVNWCKESIEAIASAVWDPKKEDTRLDDGTTNIDIIDAIEYAFTPYMKNLNANLDIMPVPKKPIEVI